MSETLRRVQTLVMSGQAEVSQHGFRKLMAADILLDDVVAGIGSAIPIEDYPDAFKGPSVLALQRDAAGRSIHVV